uniref:AIG1-type G domain-containing protein n=1 Tax=Amphiprion percula TaxID=161767 RepID=A0A3P8SJG4_AMPPE
MEMQTRKNRRGRPEHYVSGRHLNLNDLKQEARHLRNQYLNNVIPNSPKPEFHVTRLKHDTDQDGLSGIRKDEGFRVPHKVLNDPHAGVLLWWSLAVDHEEVKSAETRLLQQKFSNLTEDEATMHPSFLYKFTSSPAFSEKSRLGSYRFTFNLKDVLEAYSLQFCSGDQPIMRVYETVLHRQEVQHTVLVHSPANQELFSKYYPLLVDDPNAVCVYKDDHFIWRPYAMSETHWYELVERPGENQMDAHEWNKKRFYIWDHVTIALHVDKQVLKFDANQLRKNLTFCLQGEPAIGTFDSFEDAENQVKYLWPDCDSPLDKECSLKQRFTDLRLVLVGRTGSGKSSSGNIILGRDAFSTGGAAASSSSGNVQCCLQMEKVFDWEVTVVDTPGLSENLEIQMEILKCIAMSAPGPHAFLLVIKVGPQINEEQDAVRQMEVIFGKNVWSHTFVVLTYNDQPKIDVQILEKNKTELKKILPGRVEDRCYVLNNNQQVWDLLDEVAKMAVANNVYSCKDRVVQDLRLVFVGRTGSGKSSSGNIILGRDVFSTGGAAASSSSGNAQCCLQTKKVFHWKVTVVETPGLSETPEVKTEIRRCVDMLAPGPHAFLLVIKVGPQMDEEQDTMRQMEEIFGENVWWFTFVVLIYDDQSETDIELQVVVTEDELKKILPQRVGDRYYNHSINSWNSLQDYYLLREVEKMVVANRGKFYSVQDSAKKRKITDVDDVKID